MGFIEWHTTEYVSVLHIVDIQNIFGEWLQFNWAKQNNAAPGTAWYPHERIKLATHLIQHTKFKSQTLGEVNREWLLIGTEFLFWWWKRSGIRVMIAQSYEYSKNHWIVRFKRWILWYVNYMTIKKIDAKPPNKQQQNQSPESWIEALTEMFCLCSPSTEEEWREPVLVKIKVNKKMLFFNNSKMNIFFTFLK